MGQSTRTAVILGAPKPVLPSMVLFVAGGQLGSQESLYAVASLRYATRSAKEDDHDAIESGGYWCSSTAHKGAGLLLHTNDDTFVN